MKKIFTTFLMIIACQVYSQLKPVAYTDGETMLNGFSAAPVKGTASKPGILILPAWKGIDAHSKDVAQKLSALGYYVFIADIYGVGNYPKTNEEAAQKSGFYKKNYERYQVRIDLALNELTIAGANPDNIVAIGYCFGGTGVLEAARGGIPVKGVVSFHGGLGKDANRKHERFETKVLVCHGADDPYVPEQEVLGFMDEMRESDADWQLIYYSDAVHAFTEPAAGNDKTKGAAYNEKADKRSWQHLLGFLKEVLK